MGFFIFRIILAIAIIAAVDMGYKAYEAYTRDQNQQDKHHHEDDI